MGSGVYARDKLARSNSIRPWTFTRRPHAPAPQDTHQDVCGTAIRGGSALVMLPSSSRVRSVPVSKGVERASPTETLVSVLNALARCRSLRCCAKTAVTSHPTFHTLSGGNVLMGYHEVELIRCEHNAHGEVILNKHQRVSWNEDHCAPVEGATSPAEVGEIASRD